MPQTANEIFLDTVLRHQVGLSRVSGDIQKRVFGLLNETEKDLRWEIRRRLDGKPRGLGNKAGIRRMRGLVKALKAIRFEAWKTAENDLTGLMKDLTRTEVEFMGKAVSSSVPVVLEPALPSVNLLTVACEHTTF